MVHHALARALVRALAHPLMNNLFYCALMVHICDLLAHLWTNNLYILLAPPLMSIFHHFSSNLSKVLNNPISSNVEEMQLPLALQQYDLFYNPLSNMPFHMFSHKGHVCMHGHKFS